MEHGRYIALVETVAGPIRLPAGRHVTGIAQCVLLAPHPVRVVGAPNADGDAALRLRQLAELQRLGEPADVYPLVTHMGRDVEISKAEHLLGEYMATLFDVCRRPNTRLVSVEEVVWLARAKRLAPRAEAWIDGHPEHWTGWERGLPMPSRAPATQADVDLDVYENRVTARLIDARLLPRLRQRIAALKSKQPATDRFRASTGAHHLLQSRLGELWDVWAVGNVQQFHERIEATLTELERRAAQVRRLRHTPLYGGIPRNVSVPTVLRQTNVLRGDARYRRVGELWDAFRRSGRPTPTERAEVAEKLAVGHARFTRILVARALRHLDWDGEGMPDRVLVEEIGDGNLHLRAGDAPPLRVIPLLSIETSAALAAKLPALPDTLIVHGKPDDEPAPGVARKIGATWFVSTSPLDLNAVEAVGYAMHNHVLDARLRRLAPEATLSDRLAEMAARLGLLEPRAGRGHATYVLDRPLPELEDELRRQRRQSTLRGPDAQAFARDLERAGTQLRDAEARLAQASRCPRPHCGGSGRVVNPARDRYVIDCTARDCTARWGMQTCSACGERRAFFTLHDMSDVLSKASLHGFASGQEAFGMIALGELGLVGGDVVVRCSCGHDQPVSVRDKQ